MGNYHRQDIQGIRALAIFLVVAAHIEIPYLESGFIGVDIFFVISGYLITGLIYRELSANQSISFLTFYYRRIKRLLPALLFMMVVACSASVIFLSPVEQIAQIESAKKAVIWLSNYYFAFANYGYFDATSETFLFLHTWSLGVEEQFYLVWPLLLLLFARAGSFDKKLIIKGVGYVFVFGFILSVVLTEFQPSLAFYLMPSRAWQFATGGLVYFYSSELRQSQFKIFGKSLPKIIIGLSGFAMILISLFFVKKASYPGAWALLPTFGACCMLMASVSVQEEKHVLSRVLSARVPGWFGKISYSLYLWHWPVIVLGGGTVLGDTSFQTKILLVTISIILAAFSYYIVESPIRFSQYFSRRQSLGFVAAGALTLAGFGLTHIWFFSAEGWAKSPEQSQYLQATRSFSKIYIDGCDDWYQSDRLKPCVYGNVDAENSVVLLGDSIGAQWFPTIEKAFHNDKWKIIVITKSSCPIIDEPYYYRRLGRNYTECESWRNRAIQWIIKNKPQYLFMGNAKTHFDKAQWVGGTDRILQKLHAGIPKIYILQPTYSLTFNGPNCQSRFKWQENFIKPLAHCQTKPNTGRMDRIGNWLKIVANRYSNVEVLNMNPFLCINGICSAEDGDVIIYRDGQHVTIEFAESLSGRFKKMINL